MANLTDERLKEMEEEMNRFEEEILENGVVVPAKMIIGTRTFSQVEAQLSNRTTTSPPPAVDTKPQETAPKSIFTGSLTPPPPPPGAPIGPKLPESVLHNTQPPPPPPPPGFLPPQLRQRPPAPPMPPRCPMPPHMMPGGGGMMPPCGPPMGMGMGPPRPPPPRPNMMQPPHMFGGGTGPPAMNFRGGSIGPPPMNAPLVRPAPPTSAPSFSFSRPPSMSSSGVSNQPLAGDPPKIVYSAPPVRRITTDTAKSSTNATTGAVVAKGELETHVDVLSKSAAVAGIELNVPVQKIVAEKNQNFSVAEPATAASASSAMNVDGNPQATAGTSGSKKEKKEKKKKFVRMAAGTVWEDQTLGEWDPDDFRLFCGDLGNEVTDETLARAFNKYPSFQKARVIRDKKSNKTKGFGFVSFKDPNDFTRAMREMNGKYVGNRPIKLRKSQWRERQIDIVKRKDREKKRLGFK